MIQKSKIKIGSKIKFAKNKKRFTVMAHSKNFTICTQPLNQITRLGKRKYKHTKTYLYTIIDWGRKVRGPDDLIFGSFWAYDTLRGAGRNLAALERGLRERKGDFSDGQKDSQQVSYRREVELDIEAIIP